MRFCSQNIQLLSCVTVAPSLYVTLLGRTIKTHHRGPDWLIAFCYLNITVILRMLLLLGCRIILLLNVKHWDKNNKIFGIIQ